MAQGREGRAWAGAPGWHPLVGGVWRYAEGLFPWLQAFPVTLVKI